MYQVAATDDADLAHLPANQRGVRAAPPNAVRMPMATFMPRRSSGLVSLADEDELDRRCPCG